MTKANACAQANACTSVLFPFSERKGPTIRNKRYPGGGFDHKKPPSRRGDGAMDLEERAFSILTDLGMIELNLDPEDPNRDTSKDDDDME